MNKKKIKLEEIGNASPFNVPEGYFESFAEDMISRLPDRAKEEPQVVSLWMHVKPWAYMAAMFAGIALMIRLFVGSPDSFSHNSNALNLSSSAEIEEFYDYYENQVIKSYYRETFYLALEDDSYSVDD